jgi:4-methylaminobutanoate oxidase (formaldehyde-forming)
MLNDRGGIEADLTVARTGPERFYVVTGTGFATHDLDWIARGIPEGARAEVVDVTSAFGVLSLMGPKARAILSRVTAEDVSNAAFPFGHVRVLPIAGAPVTALRVTYVGELGWELHVPTESVISVYEALMVAGREHGLVNAGYRAIETLRLEKGYRAWGAEIGPDHTPVEAGLGWAVKLRSGKPFRGREAVAAQVAGGVRKLLAGFSADPGVVLHGRETIYRDGERVGWLASGGYGHTVGRSIGYGYVRRAEGVDRDWVAAGTYELEVATERVPCSVHLAPLWDPEGARI